MSFIKKALSSVEKPSSFDLHYSRITDPKEAWRLFFKRLLSSLKHLNSDVRKAVSAEVVPLPLNKEQKILLNEISNFLHRCVKDISNHVLEYVDLMRKFKDNETFHMILAEFQGELAYQLSSLRRSVTLFRRQAEAVSVTHTKQYKSLDKYLQELSLLTSDVFVNDYLLKGTMPLDGFDEEFLE